LTQVSASEGLRRVTAMVRCSALQKVEERLKQLHVPGISVTKVKGYGEYADFFRSDWVREHARIEVYCGERRADEIARAVVEVAHTGARGDGTVVVLPVEAIYRVRTSRAATADEIGGRRPEEGDDG